MVVCVGDAVTVGVAVTEGVAPGVSPAAEFSGAPTAMSHLWPGLPCSGFNATLEGAACDLTTAGSGSDTGGTWLVEVVLAVS